jgi:hypothetical protein
MELRDLATTATALLAGAGGTGGLKAFERWAYAHRVEFTSTVNVIVYMALFVVPFATFVIGIDPRRWQSDYGGAYGPKFQAEYPEIVKRSAMYFVGSVMGNYVI